MDAEIVERKRRQFAISAATAGLVIAAVFFAYFETDPQPAVALWAGGLAVVLCPASVFFVTWIDIEPQTTAFTVMWLIIGLLNGVLYGGIGMLVSRFLWKAAGLSQAKGSNK